MDSFDKEAVFEILSPDREQLSALIPRWRAECAKHGLTPGCDPQPEIPAGFESYGVIDIERAADENSTPTHR